MAQIYDQHLGVSSPLRQSVGEEKKPQGKRRINPEQLEKQVILENDSIKRKLTAKRPASALKLEFSSMARQEESMREYD